MGLGFQVWSQYVDWTDLMTAGRAIEEHRFDALWSNDHLMPVIGDSNGAVREVNGPIFEGWMVLAGWARYTHNVRLGCLVSGAGYRNPGLLVKMATALDHLSGGRAVLGLGAGWYEREHRAFGFPYPSVSARMTRLEEQAMLIRRLLDGESVSFGGAFVTVDGATNEPGPLQHRMPFVIGGNGEQRLLRTVARYADIWNGTGDPAAIRRRNAILDDHCAAVGRDPRSIKRTVGVRYPLLVRPSVDVARNVMVGILERHSMTAAHAVEIATDSPLVGTVDNVVRVLEAYRDAGAESLMFEWPAPFDPATLDALAGPVRDRLG